MTQLPETNMPEHSPYQGLASGYDRARPAYPDEALALLPVRDGDLVADIGAGTGIFSRQMARTFPAARIIGVEPGSDMRRRAEDASRHLRNLSFVTGAAEALPLPADRFALVTAATAAHWFDRPRFYPEAFRCLAPGRMLAIVQNKRRWWDSAFLAAYEDLHEETVPGYLRGTFPAGDGGYAPIDAAAELAQRHEAADVHEHSIPWTQITTRPDFVTFSLSSSITQKAVKRLGEPAYLARLEHLIERYADASGQLGVPYVTTVVTAVKAGLPA
ncbi:class I SAM-dependent methyltransferase [Roseiarcaceae bacterium H3SJ34-1]|uniref:class I SAM-dependent methyltransferase n=1 Tax=Terripilifer ovatus TaxID=3032367 RepID=UPI003AB98E70|nr:class I SAM-dependent methyltransferase [Roseiarcaceae bacterium H3SJ34-1]